MTLRRGGMSVLRRPPHAVDDEHLDWCLARFEAETELLAKRRRKRGGARGRRSRIRPERVVGSVVDVDVEVAAELRLVDNGPTNKQRQGAGKPRHVHGAGRDAARKEGCRTALEPTAGPGRD